MKTNDLLDALAAGLHATCQDARSAVVRQRDLEDRERQVKRQASAARSEAAWKLKQLKLKAIPATVTVATSGSSGQFVGEANRLMQDADRAGAEMARELNEARRVRDNWWQVW